MLFLSLLNIIFKQSCNGLLKETVCFIIHPRHLYLGILDKVTDVSVSFHSVEWRTDASKPPIVQHDPDFNLICNFSPLNMPNVLYKITWYINSTEIPMQQVVSADTRENATLSAKDMLRYNIKKLNVFVSQ